MFSDPQFWVAVSFFLFIAAIFNPVRKVLTSNLDTQIHEIKLKIDDAEKLKMDAERTLTELKQRQLEVENEINKLRIESDKKIDELKNSSSKKLSEQIEKKKLLADSKIQQLVRDTNIGIKNYITNVAVETAVTILQENLNNEKRSELIDKSVNDFESILKN